MAGSKERPTMAGAKGEEQSMKGRSGGKFHESHEVARALREEMDRKAKSVERRAEGSARKKGTGKL